MFTLIYNGLVQFAALGIMITVLARLNDIKRTDNGKRWWCRRLSLLMVFTSMVMVVGAYWTKTSPYWFLIQRFLLLWGTFLMLITTPASPKGMPPWYKLITRYDPT
jgi:hypothetical protein